MKIPRKSFITSLSLGLCSIPAILKGAESTPEKSEPRYTRVKWKKLTDEPIRPGDIWVPNDEDPNEPEKINRKKEKLHLWTNGAIFGLSPNVDLNASSRSHWGIPANKVVGQQEKTYWRPVAIVDVF